MVGCGIEAESPESLSSGGDAGDDVTVISRAVYIEEVNSNVMGTKVLCRLHEDFPFGEPITVFIEFEGTPIETKSFPSANATVPFDRYRPAIDGEIFCVIEFSGAQFESEPLFIEAP